MSSIGQRVRELRQRRGWSQQDLAGRVGVRQKQISSYERDVNTPSGSIFIAIAKALEVSLDYLAAEGNGTTTPAQIADRELLEKVQELDRLPEDERILAKQVIDLVVRDHRFRKLAEEGRVSRQAG